MKNSKSMEQLFKKALSPTAEPGEDINRKIINMMKERDTMKPVFKKSLSVAFITVLLILAMSITAFAAWKFLSPKQVAEHFGNKTLAKAFDDKNAIEINKTVVSGGYSITLHGIVSGEGLSDFKNSSQEIHPDRTYAVVSIARVDGSEMPDTMDEEYGQVPFFISPLIKGQKPWQVNIASMNGGYSAFVVDGIMYRLIECDGVEMFADRGLYLCISTSTFYDKNAFNYNEKTGEVTPNTNYEGANALFDLPLDIKKADHEKAEKYLQELLKPSTESTGSEAPPVDWEKEFADAVVIPESVKVVTIDEKGMAHYEYDGGKMDINLNYLFEGQPTVTSKIASIQGTDDESIAIRFSRDANGTITAMALRKK